MPEVERHEDLARLRKRVAVPALFEHGAWVAVPRGASTSDLGPAEMQLILWLPVTDEPDIDTALRGGATVSWVDVEQALGAPGPTRSRAIPARAAIALLPKDALGVVGIDGERAIVAGRTFDAAAFQTVFWTGAWAVAIDGGLVVSLVSS